MKKFNFTTAYTHSGTFHLDDVLSTVLVKKLNKDIVVHRVSEVPKDIDDKCIVYDIGLGRFDHHQDNPRLNRQKSPYCAFGLLFESYGRLLLKKEGFKHFQAAFFKFVEEIVEKVDRGDNFGYNPDTCIPEQLLIKSFNPNYNDLEKDKDAGDKQFNKAVQIMTLVFDNWLRQLYLDVELKGEEQKIWEQGKTKDGKVVILAKDIQWKQFANEDKGVDFIIAKSNRDGFNIISTGSKEIKDHALIKFMHRSKKFAVTNTLSSALRVCGEI